MNSFRAPRGIIPPLLTPLDSQGRLDRAGYTRVIDRIINARAAGIFALGTTGEAPSLAQSVQREAVKTACDAAAGRVPVLVGISNTSLEESLALARHARDCGVKAVVATPPYYFPMTQGDLAAYFLRLAEESPLPVFLYNMPACAHVAIEPQTVEACTRSANIIGVKDSSGDMAYFRRLLQFRSARPDWGFFVGPEHLLAEVVLAGGDGGVTGGANVVPELFVAQFHAADKKDSAEIARLQQRIEQLGRIYAVGDDFMAVARGAKCALSIMGVCGDTMAPPFHAYGEEQRTKIAKLLESFDWLRGE